MKIRVHFFHLQQDNMFDPTYQCLLNYHANRCIDTTYRECYIVTTQDVTNTKTITCLNLNVVLN